LKRFLLEVQIFVKVNENSDGLLLFRVQARVFL